MATGRVALSPRAPRDTPRAVHIVDTPETRVHRMADLIGLLGVAVGIVVVLLLGAYAHGTTEGITTDVQGVSVDSATAAGRARQPVLRHRHPGVARRGHHRPGDSPRAAPHP